MAARSAEEESARRSGGEDENRREVDKARQVGHRHERAEAGRAILLTGREPLGDGSRNFQIVPVEFRGG